MLFMMSAAEQIFFMFTLVILMTSLIQIGLRIATSMSEEKSQRNALSRAIVAILANLFAHWFTGLCLCIISALPSYFLVLKIMLGILFFLIPFKIRNTTCKSLKMEMIGM